MKNTSVICLISLTFMVAACGLKRDPVLPGHDKNHKSDQTDQTKKAVPADVTNPAIVPALPDSNPGLTTPAANPVAQ